MGAGLGPDEIEPADAPSWLIEQVTGGNRRQRERPPDQDRQQDKRAMNGHGQHPGGSVDAWAAKALEEECRAVAQAGKGGRNNALEPIRLQPGATGRRQTFERGPGSRGLGRRSRG